jgi:hypothetical protein
MQLQLLHVYAQVSKRAVDGIVGSALTTKVLLRLASAVKPSILSTSSSEWPDTASVTKHSPAHAVGSDKSDSLSSCKTATQYTNQIASVKRLLLAYGHSSACMLAWHS